MTRSHKAKEAAMPRTIFRITNTAAAAAALALGALALAASAHAPPTDPPPAEPPATSPSTPPTPPPAPSEEPAAPPAQEEPASPPTSPAPSPLPGLDELLGLPGDRKHADAPTDTQDPSETDLDRRLSGQQIDHAFREAVALMDQAAKRLGATDAQRAGVGTQRIQEDAVRKLEQLIASLEQQANSKSRSSSSSASQGQQQSRSQPQQQQQQSRSEQAQGENNSEMEPPARQDGQLRPELDSARASWGALPERVRDMLLQGSSDQFSSMYEKMTESYYRRLAEERRPQ